MNRAQFFSQIKKDFIDAVKETISPVIDDDIKKIDSVIDDIAGVKWVPLDNIYLKDFKGTDEKYINNRLVLIYSDGNEIKAYDKECDECNSIVHWISYENKLKCFQCGKEFLLEQETGELILKKYKLKSERNKLYLGMKG